LQSKRDRRSSKQLEETAELLLAARPKGKTPLRVQATCIWRASKAHIMREVVHDVCVATGHKRLVSADRSYDPAPR